MPWPDVRLLSFKTSNLVDHVCANCATASASEDSVLLWDGNTYCRNCIKSASPMLLKYALENTELVEETPNLMKAQLLCFAKMLLFLLPFGLFFGWQNIGHPEFLKGVCLGIVAVLLAIGMVSTSHLFAARAYGSVVRVAAGDVSATRRTFPATVRASLYECQWKYGKGKEDTWLPSSVTQRAIIIKFPSRGVLSRGHRAVCGWSPETFEVWKAFLTLAKVST